MAEALWGENPFGIFLMRTNKDNMYVSDAFCYIHPRTLCILDFSHTADVPVRDRKPVIIAGPFPTLEAAKAAFVLLYGRDHATD